MPDNSSGGFNWGQAAAAIGAAGINWAASGSMNKKSREFSEKMYGRQYKDSIAFWNMKNQYNSPEAQMQRFKDAGLNPNLIYDRGDSGQSSPMSPPSAVKPDFNVPDVGSAIGNYFDLQLKQAQHDNLLATNDVLTEEALNKRAARDRMIFDLQFASDLRETDADARREALRLMQQNYVLTGARDERDVERHILDQRGKQLINEGIKKDNFLKSLDIDLKKMGIQPGDKLYWRVLGRAINDRKFSNKFK